MTDLDTLIAERDIRRVLSAYCRAMDRIDADLGYTIWHDDGDADYGPLFTGTGREFVDWVCDFHRGIDGHSHQIAGSLIDVVGDRATSETYVSVELLRTEDGRRVVDTGRGRYLDTWSRRGGRWAIDHRRYLHDFHLTFEVEVTEGWGSRDRTDPSYQVLAARTTADNDLNERNEAV